VGRSCTCSSTSAPTSQFLLPLRCFTEGIFVGLQTPSHTADRQKAQCCSKSRKPSTQSYCKRRRPRRRQRQRGRPGLTMFTDGSRLDNGATGYAVVWNRGLIWAGVKGHMGSNQEAYDAECAALAHALEEASRRNTTPERVTIFTNAQAAIRRMASDEPGPGQQYAL